MSNYIEPSILVVKEQPVGLDGLPSLTIKPPAGSGFEARSADPMMYSNNPFNTTTDSEPTLSARGAGAGRETRETAAHAQDAAYDAAQEARDIAYDKSQNARDTAYDLSQNTRATANDAAEKTKQTANDLSQNAKATANDLSQKTQATANDLSQKTQATAHDLSQKTQATAQNAKATANDLAQKTKATANETATGIRQRVNHLSSQLDETTSQIRTSPAYQNAQNAAGKQIQSFREVLGRYPLVVDLEKRTNVDRVILVVGGLIAYLVLIPLNFLGLALPTTTLLALGLPTYLAGRILDRSGAADSTAAEDVKTKSLLAYFVVLGFVQLLESLAAGLMEKTIPQYYTVKLLFLAYLLHPRTQGALQIHNAVLKPALTTVSSPPYETATTPPTSKPASEPASTFTVPAGTKFTLPSGGGTGTGLEVEK
ncbi:hypothetical protein P7C73_g1182, partial [Tremellales sp. Uapishka_1]